MDSVHGRQEWGTGVGGRGGNLLRDTAQLPWMVSGQGVISRSCVGFASGREWEVMRQVKAS